MRDYKFDCNTYDKYSKNTYSKGFDNINIKNVDLLTSFEVIEHFEDPAEEFMKIFNLKPKIILITTSLYKNQNQEWEYLELDTGQHIFFYSKKAILELSKKNDYEVFFLESGFILMTSNNFKFNKSKIFFIKKILVREKFFYILRFLRIFLSSNGFEKDYKKLKN